MASFTTRKQQDGKTRTTAQIRIKLDGVIHSESRTFSTRVAATTWARQREDEIRAHPEQAKKKTATVGALIDAYLASAVDAFGRSKGQHLRLIASYPLASLDAVSLTRQQLIAHVQARRQAGTGPSTVANDLIWLRVVWRYARMQGYSLSLELLDDVAEYCRAERLIARPAKRIRRPSREEMERIITWFRGPKRARRQGPPMYLILWFAIYSCRRQAEIFDMRLSDYDRNRGTWLIRSVKHPGGSAGHDLAMRVPDRLKPLIETIIRDVPRTDDRLLPFNSRTIGSYWRNQMRLLGIDDLHFHDLRREGVSRLAEDGLTIPEMQRVSLHESWSSLQIYVNLPPTQEARLEWEP